MPGHFYALYCRQYGWRQRQPDRELCLVGRCYYHPIADTQRHLIANAQRHPIANAQRHPIAEALRDAHSHRYD